MRALLEHGGDGQFEPLRWRGRPGNRLKAWNRGVSSRTRGSTLRLILLEAGLPAFLMGFSFPLANAITQRTERDVGRRAGVLYLANTCRSRVRQL